MDALISKLVKDLERAHSRDEESRAVLALAQIGEATIDTDGTYTSS